MRPISIRDKELHLFPLDRNFWREEMKTSASKLFQLGLTALFLLSLSAGLGAQAAQILWWHDLDAPSFGSASAGDIDNDGKLELVFGTYFNDEKIHALNAEDGSELWSYDTGGCNDASPIIYDVDLDGALEVILPASSPCRVFCFDGATGAVEWSFSTSYNCLDSPPAVADVDEDGLPEIVFGAWGGYVYCLNGENGTQRWRVNVGTSSYIQSEPNILDVDGDGDLDVVVAQWAGDSRVYALEGLDGSTLWYSDAPDDWMYHGGSFADIDEDGKPEIAIGCYDNSVYLLNAEDGSLEWKYTDIFYVGAPTSVADLNGDGHLETVFVSYNRVGVLSHTGTRLWSYSVGGNVFRGAAIADVDGDGGLDVAFGCDDGLLRVLNGDTGTLIWSYNLKSHYGQTFEMDNAPVIADFDNDGKLDIFIIGGYGTSSNPSNNHGRAYALTAGDGTGPGWPKFRHDIRNSGCFDGFSTGPTLTADNVAGGQTATLTCSGASGTLVYFGASLTGDGPTFFPPLGITLDLSPVIYNLGSDAPGPDGTASISRMVPPSLTGQPIWLQAVDLVPGEPVTSNLVSLTVQ